ncbi:M15 family metallopeptidase [Pseudoalteromonas sp. SCSIO 43201]|uniref:M15 family metallopeptidase n=1 Tax=Pseudoalteromonas sp. SCSIO 43201 TaxID=2822842 RepID=UPI00207565F4|nr:M15 family metallopeptidase [Pseudoalteromonas sp. SCSIO 43201]
MKKSWRSYLPSRSLTAAQCIACGVNESHLICYNGRYVHREIVDDLASLINAAKLAGFTLYMASAFRSFERQKSIWEHKFSMRRPVLDLNNQAVDLSELSEIEKVRAIMLFSALPGASRHHFGTDIDVYARDRLPAQQSLQLEPWEYQEGGHQYEFSVWLDSNLERYGFYRPYDRFRGGVAAEPWHISHWRTAKPLADLQSPATLKALLAHTNIGAKTAILDNLEALHQQFIANIAPK